MNWTSFGRKPAENGKRRYRSSPGILAISLIVGMVAGMAGQLTYRCVAVLKLPKNVTTAQLAGAKSELLSMAQEQLARSAAPNERLPAWSVEIDNGQFLRLTVLTSDTKSGVDQVRGIGQAVATKLRLAAMETKNSPSEAERIVSDHVSELQSRLLTAEKQVEQLLVQLPASDPGTQHDELLNTWKTLRGRFADQREKLGEAAALHAQLASTPEPSRALVNGDDRRKALDADEVLQQDLRELTVAITETKHQMLNIWQRANNQLDRFHSAATAMTDQFADGAAKSRETNGSTKDPEFAENLRPLANSAAAFRENWLRENSSLQQLTVEPMSSEILDLHARARNLLRDYLFDIGKKLGAARSTVDSNVTDASARGLVARSARSRSFHELEALQHQFELAAGDLDSRENFRLDSALNKARALRRRTQERIRGIDEKLESVATLRVREQLERDRADAKKTLDDTRTEADETVEQLVVLQESLNINAGLNEQFLKSVLQVELARGQLKTTESDLRRNESRLREMETRRASGPDFSEIELISAGVVGSPVNLGERIRTGFLACLFSFALICFAQWKWNRDER